MNKTSKKRKTRRREYVLAYLEAQAQNILNKGEKIPKRILKEIEMLKSRTN